jgi:HAD superfamily hydrolase (TIGR01509 family)
VTGPRSSHRGEIEVVLFDIGGVLVDFAGLAAITELTGSDSQPQVEARWLLSPWVRRFESGHCSPADFAAGITADQFLELFLSWLHDPFPGAEELVNAAAAHVTVGCLSNTNALHWQAKISKWPLTDHFEHRLLSFELGVVKPDHAIFELSAARVGTAPDRILFLDDNVLNVHGARAAGMTAEQARGPDQARAVLSRYGLAD